MRKKTARMTIDIAMTVLLPMMMAYSLIGEAFHEITGTALLVLFIVHHILNRRWYGSLRKGRYNARRVFQTVLDMMLLVFMIAQPVSGILMSKHVYTFLPALPVSAQARSVHMMLAYWGYVLMCLHAGTHLTGPFGRMKKSRMAGRVCICIALGAVSVYGLTAFFKRGFPGYMSGTTMFAFFDFSEPIAWFILDYLAVMVLFMMAGCLISIGLSRISSGRIGRK